MAALLQSIAVPVRAMGDDDRRLFVALTDYVWDPARAEAALAAGADVNARNEAMNDETLVILAIKGAVAPEVFAWLVAHGADPRLRDRSGKSALDWAHVYGLDKRADGRRILALLGDQSDVASQPVDPALAGAEVSPAGRAAVASPQPAPGESAQMFAAAPAPGVYECINQQAMISPMAFGIVDAATYMSSMGKLGAYSYDARTGVLSLDPGAAPARFQRISPTTFRAITPAGELGGFTCPLNRAKDPSSPPW